MLAAIGSAVGIGNLWRFPYIFATNGGAAFLIPYIICMAVIGLPLMLLETAAGEKARKSLPAFLKGNWMKLLSLAPILISLAILSYYTVITGWVLFHAINLPLSHSSSFAEGANPLYAVPVSLAILMIAFLVAIGGLHKGLERTLDVMIPLFFTGLVALFLFSISLPGHFELATGLFKPDFSKMLDPDTWLFAMSQALYSLSVGFAILYCYGAYLKARKGLATTLFTVMVADLFVSLLAVGTTLPVAMAAGEATGFSLMFDSTLRLFAQMPSGLLFGSVFFALLFLAAFTSIISMFESPLFTMRDYFKIGRRKAAAIVAIVMAPAVVFSAFGYAGATVMGLPAVEGLDLIFGSLLAPFSALVLALLLSARLDVRKLFKETGVPDALIGPSVLIATKIAPLVLLALGIVGLAGLL
mgnify:CR=1 FL=1